MAWVAAGTRQRSSDHGCSSAEWNVLSSPARTLVLHLLGQGVYTPSLVQKEAFFYPGFACALLCFCETADRKHEPKFSVLIQNAGTDAPNF